MPHQQVHFLYGARQERDVCGLDMLQALPNWSQRGHYHAVLSNEDADAPRSPERLSGFVHDALATLHSERLADFEIYFAGPPLMAQAMLKLLIEQKVPMEQVHFDQFY
jgi:toluene monooxygenase electron transfer component